MYALRAPNSQYFVTPAYEYWSVIKTELYNSDYLDTSCAIEAASGSWEMHGEL